MMKGKRLSPESDLLISYKLDHQYCENPSCSYGQAIGYRIRGGVHHIIYRSHGGTDEHKNLITLCSKCHTMVHDGLITKQQLFKIKGTNDNF